MPLDVEQQVQNEGPDLLTALGMLLRTTDIPRQAVLGYAGGFPLGNALGQVVDPSLVLSGEDVIEKQLPELINASPAAAAGLGTLLEFADPLQAAGAFFPSHADPTKYDAWHATTRPGPTVPQPPHGIHIGTRAQALDRIYGAGSYTEDEVVKGALDPAQSAKVGGDRPIPRLVPVRADVPQVAGPYHDWGSDYSARFPLNVLRDEGFGGVTYRNTGEDPYNYNLSMLVFDPAKVTVRDPAAGPAMESLYDQTMRAIRGLGESGGAGPEDPIKAARRQVKEELLRRGNVADYGVGSKQTIMPGDKVITPELQKLYPDESVGFTVKNVRSDGTATLFSKQTGETFERPIDELKIVEGKRLSDIRDIQGNVPKEKPYNVHLEGQISNEKILKDTDPQYLTKEYHDWMLGLSNSSYIKALDMEAKGVPAKEIMDSFDPNYKKFAQTYKAPEAEASVGKDYLHVGGWDVTKLVGHPNFSVAYNSWLDKLSPSELIQVQEYQKNGYDKLLIMNAIDPVHFQQTVKKLGAKAVY